MAIKKSNQSDTYPDVIVTLFGQRLKNQELDKYLNHFDIDLVDIDLPENVDSIDKQDNTKLDPNERSKQTDSGGDNPTDSQGGFTIDKGTGTQQNQSGTNTNSGTGTGIGGGTDSNIGKNGSDPEPPVRVGRFDGEEVINDGVTWIWSDQLDDWRRKTT